MLQASIVISQDGRFSEEQVRSAMAWAAVQIPDQALLAILCARFGLDLLVEIADAYGRILYISRDGAWFDGELTPLDGIDGGLPCTGMVELHDILKNARHDAVAHYAASSVMAGDDGYYIRLYGEETVIPYYWVTKGAI